MPQTPQPLVSELMLETFRLNGALLSAGDTLVADLGLTSARWQVIGAVALEERALTVSQIARRMGLSRQAVQRVVNDLVRNGLAALKNNPDHRRAPLIALTAMGEAAYAEADRRQRTWGSGLAEGLDPATLKAALTLLRELRARCAEVALPVQAQ